MIDLCIECNDMRFDVHELLLFMQPFKRMLIATHCLAVTPDLICFGFVYERNEVVNHDVLIIHFCDDTLNK